MAGRRHVRASLRAERCVADMLRCVTMSDKLIERARALVDPGEVIQGAFAAQSHVRSRFGDGGYRVVVATDRRLLLFQSGTFSQTVIKRLIEESPRGQLLGEPSGLFHTVTVGGSTLKVNFRYFDQVRAIDRALGDPTPEPGPDRR